MEEKDNKIISELINKYGIEKVKRMIKLDNEFIDYMSNPGKFIINRKQEPKLYCETENSQIFTNGLTSIFYLNNKELDFNLLKQLTLQPTLVEPNEINKYLEKSNDLFGNARTSVTLTNDHGLVYLKKLKEDIETFSLNEFKLLFLLLKDPIIYASLKNTMIYAESEKGYAYILTKKNNMQLLF